MKTNELLTAIQERTQSAQKVLYQADALEDFELVDFTCFEVQFFDAANNGMRISGHVQADDEMKRTIYEVVGHHLQAAMHDLRKTLLFKADQLTSQAKELAQQL